jgi:hypothetical protein
MQFYRSPVSSEFFSSLFVSDFIAVMLLMKAEIYEVPHMVFFIVPER